MLEGERSGAAGIEHGSALSDWLDTMRWLAAAAVVLGHVNGWLFNYGTSGPKHHDSVIYLAFAALSGWARPAVIVFFVLSGYLVGGGALRKFRQGGSFKGVDYVVARLSRLWLVLLPAYALIALLAWIRVDHFLAVPVQSAIFDRLNTAETSWPVLLCNAAFLNTALCGSYGGDGALWSLFNEFWYYMAWPPIMIALFGRGSALRRGLLILLPLAGLALLSVLQWKTLGVPRDNVLAYFAIWAAGASLDLWPRLRVPPLAAAALFLLTLLAWRAFIPPDAVRPFLAEFVGDLAVAGALCLLISSMLHSGKLRAPALVRAGPRMASFSFSLYVLHLPILHFAMGGLLWAGIALPLQRAVVPNLFYAGAIIVTCFVVAAIFAYLTERHTLTLRRAIMKRIRARSAAQPASAG